MKKAYLALMLILVTLSSSTAQQKAKPKWVLLSVSDNMITYVSARRIVTKRKTVRLWVKHIRLSEEDKGSKNVNLQKYEKAAHSLALWEFNCGDEMMKLISVINYTDDGNSSDVELKKPNVWEPVPPESNSETMMRIACDK